MCASFKLHGIARVFGSVCIVLTVCASFAGAYAACWIELRLIEFNEHSSPYIR
jgi:hypothetical protein